MTKKKNVGRNEPCPCGSDVKHKYCCLNKGRKAFAWKKKKHDSQ